MKHLALAIAFSMMFFGCGKSHDEAGHEEHGDHAAHAEGESAGGSPCDAAAKCCEAYVGALGGAVSAEQACAGIKAAAQAGPQGEQSCNTMVAGWRTALNAAQKPIPAACAE